jgi:hypothetical protein
LSETNSDFAKPTTALYSIFWSMANKFSVPVVDLEAANPEIQDKNLIYPGQIIKVPIY